MINYPNGNNRFSKKTSYSNRGMALENDINIANKYYLNEDIAVIHKKPIPIQIVDVDYPSRKNAIIKRAYYKIPSTTDYNGIFMGKYIDFEAKETVSTTSFALKNIHDHQLEHMDRVYRHGGIVFLIVRFKKLDTTFVLPYKNLISFCNRRINGGRKSITLEEFKEKSFEVDFSYKIRIDYLKIIKDKEREFLKDE